MAESKREIPVRPQSIFSSPIILKAATSAILIAIGVVLSAINPFAYYPLTIAMLGPVKINPFVHLINAVAGVLVGPWFGIITSSTIAIIRFSTGLGTIHAFPGGIPGSFIVGVIREIILHKRPKKVHFAAFSESLGTIFIGGTISALIVMPVGTFSMMTIYIFWGIFAFSCIPGSILGFIILILLDKYHLMENYFPQNITDRIKPKSEPKTES